MKKAWKSPKCCCGHAKHKAHRVGWIWPVPIYKINPFDQIIQNERVDCVIVTTIDCTHSRPSFGRSNWAAVNTKIG
jgi:hypothetical protein